MSTHKTWTAKDPVVPLIHAIVFPATLLGKAHGTKQQNERLNKTTAMANNIDTHAGDSLLGSDEKKRKLFSSLIWLIFSLCVALPLCSMLAPIWLVLQLVEPFLPVCTFAGSFMHVYT